MIAVPLLTLLLYGLLSLLFTEPVVTRVAAAFLASVDRVLGILIFLPPWASWAVMVFIIAAGARFLLWENQKVSEGQRLAVVATVAVALLLAAVIPPIISGARTSKQGAWWRPDSYRLAGTEQEFDGIQFVWVPPGTFTMGSLEGESGRTVDETRRDVVFSKGFWMSQNEITVGQYIKVMGKAPENLAESRNIPNLPVTGVSHEEARAFAEALTHPKQGVYRLPKESEWEYACRAGTTTPWSFGTESSQLPDYAWYKENSEERPHSTGMLLPNNWKLKDMHGNAAEWCEMSAESGKAGNQVYKGGDWTSSAAQCRSAARGIFIPGGTHLPETAGIRIVREP